MVEEGLSQHTYRYAGEEREGRSLGTGEHISGVWKRGRVGL